MLHDSLQIFSPFRGTYRGSRYSAQGKTHLFEISRDEVNVIYICCQIVQADPDNLLSKSVTVSQHDRGDYEVMIELDLVDSQMRLETGFVYQIEVADIVHNNLPAYKFGGIVIRAKLAF